MHIQIVSDLHIEFGSKHLISQISQCDSDVLVIAGDLHTSKGVISTLKWLYNNIQKHIVFIMLMLINLFHYFVKYIPQFYNPCLTFTMILINR